MRKTGKDMVLSFKLKVNHIDKAADEDIRPNEVLEFLDEAMLDLIKRKYTGKHKPEEGFQRTQEVTDDLNPITSRHSVDNLSKSGDYYYISLPDNYLYFLRGECLIRYDGIDYPVQINQVTLDKSNVAKRDPFNKPAVDEPMVVFSEGGIKIYTAEGCSCTSFNFDYLKVPGKLSLNGECPLPFEDEIISHAVTLFLDTVENPRLRSQIEVNRLHD